MRSALILTLFALFLLFTNCLEAQKPTYRVYLLNGSYHDKVALESGKIQDSTSSSIQIFTADTSFYLLKKDIYAIARLDSADQMALLYKNTGADIPYPNLRRKNLTPMPLNLPLIIKYIGYPAYAREQGIQGQEIIRVLINEEGAPVTWVVVQKAHTVLHTAIEPHLSLLRFSPAKHKGDLIEFWVNIPFNFRLTE